MLILTAAVILVGILCLADMLMTFGVIRRLREHTATLGQFTGADMSVSGLGQGETPGGFSITDVDGKSVQGPAGLRLTAFFSSSCPVCPEKVPAFTDYVRISGAQRDQVLAIVVGSSADEIPYLGRLAEVAQVCVEPASGDLVKPFKINGFPAFCLLDADGSVVASGYEPAELPALELA